MSRLKRCYVCKELLSDCEYIAATFMQLEIERKAVDDMNSLGGRTLAEYPSHCTSKEEEEWDVDEEDIHHGMVIICTTCAMDLLHEMHRTIAVHEARDARERLVQEMQDIASDWPPQGN